MTELTLAQNFALMALNAQYSVRMTIAKKAALRCLAAAAVLETCLGSGVPGVELPLPQWEQLAESGTPYQKIVFQSLLRGKSPKDFGGWLKKASALSHRRLGKLEHALADSLKGLGLLEETPSILGCDLYNFSNGIKIKNYKSNEEEYTRITESVRAEALEDGPVSDESLCMLWLLRESGAMHDLFSQNDLEKVAAKMYECYRRAPLAKELYLVKVHRGTELAVKQLLHYKNSFVRTPFGGGVVFVFPILGRSRFVFIETETWFANADRRLDDIIKRLEANGSQFEVLAAGPIPIIRVDNIIYHAIPKAVIVSRLPVHGVRLLPRPPVV